MALWFWNAIKFMESQLFFLVVQRDTMHETGISERNSNNGRTNNFTNNCSIGRPQEILNT